MSNVNNTDLTRWQRAAGVFSWSRAHRLPGQTTGGSEFSCLLLRWEARIWFGTCASVKCQQAAD